MADFTIEVREIESAFYSALEDYPIFQELHRKELNDKLYRHYKYREIGFETVDMFIDRLRARMHEIMPPINALWETQSYDYDPLESIDMYNDSHSDSRTQGEADGRSHSEDASHGTSGSNSSGHTASFEMPQTANIAGENYATNAGESTSTGDSTTDSTASNDGTSHSTNDTRGTANSNTHQHGRSGPAQDLIQAERDLIMNIDMMVVEGISDLFMSIWNANYPYTHGRMYHGRMW